MIKYGLLFCLVLSISFVSSISVGNQNINEGIVSYTHDAGPINSSFFQVNNSIYWQGHTGTDGSWLTGIVHSQLTNLAWSLAGHTFDTDLNLGAFKLITTGSVSAGTSFTAIIGDDANSRAGYFDEGAIDVKIAGGFGGVEVTGGAYQINLLTGTTAGVFIDGTNIVNIADGTNALNINGGSFIMDSNGMAHFQQDGAKAFFGLADDTSIQYDGVDMIVNPREVGTGDMIVLGDINTTFTGQFGKVFITGTLQTGIAGINRAPIDNFGLVVGGGSAGLVNFYQGRDYASGVGGTRFYGYDDLSGNDIAFGIDQYGHARLTFNGGSGKYFAFGTANGDISFNTGGTTNTIALQSGANGDATFFEESASGEIQPLRIYGYPTGTALKYGQFKIIAGPKFQITSDTGEIDFDNENLTTTGTFQAGGYKSSDGSAGASGSFTTADGKTITVKNGLITAIV